MDADDELEIVAEWDMSGVRFVQLMVGPCPWDEKALLALDDAGEVWVYETGPRGGWSLWEKSSTTFTKPKKVKTNGQT